MAPWAIQLNIEEASVRHMTFTVQYKMLYYTKC